ncbi:MAG: peptidoglycan-associated lipoprotein [Sphingobacteriales bacterium]|jgi:peptidoglycan-associated lipoprotein
MKFRQQLLSFLSIAIIATALYACGSSKGALTAAERAYGEKKYATAADLYRQATSGTSREERGYLYFMAGDCYSNFNDHKNAVSWYSRAVRFGYDSLDVQYQLGTNLAKMEKFEEALIAFESQLIQYPDDEKTKLAKKEVQLALELLEQPSLFEVYEETQLNTRESEFAPMYLLDGLVFTSTREPVKGKNLDEWTGTGYLNLYYTIKNDRGRWEKAELLNKKKLKTNFNEGTSTFDKNNEIMYFTQCNGPKGKTQECAIYMVKFNDGNWEEPTLVNIPTDSATIGQPSITPDSRRLYFAGDLEGGLGGKDIWYSEKVSDTAWSTPVNMGPTINTDKDELFPFIASDGWLYFSSNGHEGMGGLDLFYTEPLESGEWDKPFNLKYPMNSTGDDFSLILTEDKAEGFFSSNRVGGRGNDDIYNAVSIPLEFNLSGKVRHEETSLIIADAILVMENSAGERLTTKTNDDGIYTFSLQPKTDYTLKVTKEKFFGDNGEVNTFGFKDNKDFIIDFKLKPIPKKEIVLNGILYDLDKATLRPESKEELKKLISTLTENPGLTIEVSSHTDSRGSNDYNLDLSQRRAQSVVDFLVENEIVTERLEAKGYGETRLLNKCADGVECTEDQHQINRRTSFTVLSEDFGAKPKRR